MMPNKGLITLLQMDGLVTQEEFKQMLELAMEGCNLIYQIQKKALKSTFIKTVEEV